MESDNVSQQIPRKKEFVSIRVNGKQIQVNKFVVLNSLIESSVLFKVRYSEQKIGFSKLWELLTKHCVLAGSAGTHSVCETIHYTSKCKINYGPM